MFKVLSLVLFVTACARVTIPPEFNFTLIETDHFQIASWQKITDPHGIYKIYIEGDGHAFSAKGMATSDPTPQGDFVRGLAFADKSSNVVYLARPCQYVKSSMCSTRHWTSARFAPEIVNSMYQAVWQIAGDRPVVLVGYSGGAQIAGLISSAKVGLNVQKVITIAGNLDHEAWSRYHHLPALNESLNLESYRRNFAQIEQVHYAGEKDTVVPPFLIKDFVNGTAPVIVIKGASHAKGWGELRVH